MTDTPGGTPPFGSFPGVAGFPQGDMMDKMWEMMRMNPFAAAVPGGSPSLSMMSDMLAPLTNVEELDKRITDMRAVEQWLKLNLNMLQSAIQALEVQRATLATLRAFGAYAQSSMEKAQASSPSPSPSPYAWAGQSEKPTQEAGEDAEPNATNEAGANAVPFDPAGWWNMLQSQFNNLASLAIAQANQAAQATPAPSGVQGAQAAPDAPDAEAPDAEAPEEKPAAVKKAPARKAPAKKKAE